MSDGTMTDGNCSETEEELEDGLEEECACDTAAGGTAGMLEANEAANVAPRLKHTSDSRRYVLRRKGVRELNRLFRGMKL